MLSTDALAELQKDWFPHITDSGLDRLVELLEKRSPFLIHGSFTRAVPMGCLATQIAWHHPKTSCLTQEAGISWLATVAGLNPASSRVIRDWDADARHDPETVQNLLDLFRNEQSRRRLEGEAILHEQELVEV